MYNFIKKGVFYALIVAISATGMGISNVKALNMPELVDIKSIELRKTLIEDKKGYYSVKVPYTWKESINCGNHNTFGTPYTDKSYVSLVSGDATKKQPSPFDTCKTKYMAGDITMQIMVMNQKNFKPSVFSKYLQKNSSAKRIQVATLDGNIKSYHQTNYKYLGEFVSIVPVKNKPNLRIVVRMNYEPKTIPDIEAKKMYKEIMSTFQQK